MPVTIVGSARSSQSPVAVVMRHLHFITPGESVPAPRLVTFISWWLFPPSKSTRATRTASWMGFHAHEISGVHDVRRKSQAVQMEKSLQCERWAARTIRLSCSILFVNEVSRTPNGKQIVPPLTFHPIPLACLINRGTFCMFLSTSRDAPPSPRRRVILPGLPPGDEPLIPTHIPHSNRIL
jgi:hypothetical protein